MGALKNVTDADFETEVVKNSKPVLVDFWAEWCGPCRMIAPILEEISRDHGDKLEIVKLNVDENPQTPSTLGIVGIPALFVYKDGEVVKQITGAKPKGALLRELADFI